MSPNYIVLYGCLQIRHGAGTGLREILKSHGAGGGKLVGSTVEQVYEPYQVFSHLDENLTMT